MKGSEHGSEQKRERAAERVRLTEQLPALHTLTVHRHHLSNLPLYPQRGARQTHHPHGVVSSSSYMGVHLQRRARLTILALQPLAIHLIANLPAAPLDL